MDDACSRRRARRPGTTRPRTRGSDPRRRCRGRSPAPAHHSSSAWSVARSFTSGRQGRWAATYAPAAWARISFVHWRAKRPGEPKTSRPDRWVPTKTAAPTASGVTFTSSARSAAPSAPAPPATRAPAGSWRWARRPRATSRTRSPPTIRSAGGAVIAVAPEIGSAKASCSRSRAGPRSSDPARRSTRRWAGHR